jgi:hypothetical protein
MLGNVDANLVELGMVENVGYPLEFHRYLVLFLRYNVLPVYCPPFPFPVLGRCRTMSTLTQLSWVGRKCDLPVGISQISRSVHELQCTSCLPTAISVSFTWSMLYNLGANVVELGMV